jgi:Domain of unknown function (DUF4397)
VGTGATARTRGVLLVRAVLVAACAVAGLLLAAPSPVSASGTGRAYVIHGLVGQTYNVYVDGKNVCPTAKAKTIVGPLQLAAGKHVVQLRKGSTVVTSVSFTVSSGSSTDLIAHSLSDAAMAPKITAYRNDLTPVAPGKARLAVVHTAAAPPADIRVDGKVLFSNVANGEGLTLVVPARTYSVDIVPSASGTTPILGPVSLPVQAGTLTRVFAIGAVSNHTMDAVVHVLPIRQVGAGAPNRVATGDGGQAATRFIGGSSRLPWAATGLLAAALLVGLGWSRRLRTRS